MSNLAMQNSEVARGDAVATKDRGGAAVHGGPLEMACATNQKRLREKVSNRVLRSKAEARLLKRVLQTTAEVKVMNPLLQSMAYVNE